MTGRGITIDVRTQLVTEECYSCHVLFAFPEALQTELLRQKQARQFYCPNGHSQHYVGKRREDELAEELERVRATLQFSRSERERLASDNMDLAKSNRGLKGANTRLKQRAHAGVCQWCNRTFQNVQRHMETKHPAEK